MAVESVDGSTANISFSEITGSLILNGQGPLLSQGEPSSQKYVTGADIRQTRLNFGVTGPKLFGGMATPKAVVEMDFFNLNGPGGYGEVSVVPRLRLAYGELNFGDTVVRFGQDWQILFANAPISLGHLAYPVTYWNGQIGWREPGVGVFQTIHTGDSKLELAAQIMKSDWENPTDFGQASTQDLNVDLGQLSGLPALEARAKWSNDMLMGFLAAHWNHVRGSAAGNEPVQAGTITTASSRNWDVVALKAGWSASYADFMFQGQVYTGKNLGPVIGGLLQFPTVADLHESGGWAQLAYNLNSNWNIQILYGTERLNSGDVAANLSAAPNGRYQSNVMGGGIQYKYGAFAVGPEVYHMVDKQQNTATSGAGAPDGVIDSNQYMLTANYNF